MRIALDMQTRPGWGGETTFFAERLADALEETGIVEVLRLYPPSRGDTPAARIWWNQWGLPKAAERGGAELLHHTGQACSWVGDLPRVLTVHDLLPLTHPKEAPSPLEGCFWGELFPRTLRNAERIVATSEHTRQMLRVGSLAGERARLEVIPFGVASGREERVPEPEVEQTLRVHGLRRPYLLVPGATTPRQDLETLLAALARLLRDGGHPDLRLVLASDGGLDHEALDGCVLARGMSERVDRVGRLWPSDLPALVRGAEAVVLPSRAEGYPWQLVEALTQGAPIVASRVTGVAEVVGEAGLLVEPGNPEALATALERALTDEDLRLRLAFRGQHRARRFAWARVARDYLEVYRKVLEPRIHRRQKRWSARRTLPGARAGSPALH